MDAFQDDNFDDLNETREERLAYDLETTAELLESWSKKADAAAACQLSPQRTEQVEVQASTSTGNSKRQSEVNVCTVVDNAGRMDPPPIVPLTTSKFDTTSNLANNVKGRTEYFQSLDKRIVSKSNIGRSRSDQGPSSNLSELRSVKGKEKEKLLPMLSTPLTEEPVALDALVPTKPCPAIGKPKLMKIPSALQIILDNFTNFEQTIEITEVGRKLKLKKGKGIVSLEKYDLKRKSKVFENCVVAVVHSLSAKGEQLVPRWAHVHRHGGKVCIRYTPEVTHIACDRDVNQASICHYLGIDDISEVREGTLIVDWKWFISSQTAGTLLPVSDLYNHDCMKAQGTIKRRSSAPSLSNPALGKRKSTNDVLASVTVGKRAKRYAPTDSETSQDPERTASSTIEGTLTRGHRWLPPAEGEQADGLDMMISGLKTGAVLETEADLEEEDVMLDETGTGAANVVSGQVDVGVSAITPHTAPSNGPYKCQTANPGGERASINEDIARGLESLGAVYEKAQHKNMFQKRSYQKAANIVRNCAFRIQDEAAAIKLKGIGLNIAQRIGEIIRNGGRSDREYFEDNEESRTVAMFGRIYGVGQKAQELWDRGARSLGDLRTGQWGLTEGQKIGLEHYDDLNDRMPRKGAQELFEAIQKEVFHICGNGGKKNEGLYVEAMGSYRRGEDTCGDLDILITRDPGSGKGYKGVLRELIIRLVEKNIVTHTLSAPSNYEADEAKWMGIGRLPRKNNPKKDDEPKSKFRRIDILMVPWKYYGAALIYFTGNDIFNRSLRLYARRNGYSLNQRGLWTDVIRDENNKKTTEGVLVASRTEQEIFDVLKIRYRPPELRRP